MLMRSLLLFGVVFCMTAGASTAEAAKGKNKGHHHVKGVVTAVDQGSISVKVHHHKKKGTAASGQAHEKKVKVGQGTKVELVSGKKGSRQKKPGSLADIKKGEHVLITTKGDTAEKVLVRAGGKKGKKKKNS